MPAVRPGVRGAVITGWGTALPAKVLTNDDLEQMMDTSDEWIRERTGIRPAPRRRHHGRALDRVRSPGDRDVGLDPLEIDALILATTTPDRAVPATRVDRAGRARSLVRRVRPERRLLRLGLRARHRPRPDRDGRRQGARDRHRHARPDHRLDRPQHRRSCSPTGRAPSCSKRSTGPGSCSAGISTPTVRPSALLYAEIGGVLQMEGKEVFRRAVRLMVDSADEVDGPRRRHRRRHHTRRPPSGEHPDHLGRARSARHPDRAGRRSSSIARATRRRRPCRSRSPTPSTTGRVKDGDLVLFVGFGAGMTAASAIVRWCPTPWSRRERPSSDAPRPDHRRRARRHHGGRIVLVTGGSRGIGLACADASPRTATASPSRTTRSPPPDGLFAVQCDVTDGRQVDAAFAAVEAEFGGPVEVLVSNAGDHQRRTAAADERGRLHLGDRRQPHRRRTGSPSAPPTACSRPAPAGSS